ncbi:uncharacterized protein LOC132942446 [Metopolophium dirhodum]|uniref:uncharacterized protein LOC132942446 n=1 Tax=Metopolophium dirhodum TaxID=44670 RepID=UPI00298FDCEA|nr:uncharacterized protein LOC132942446 [Metopolophium dirhodum]XP_060866821.1 uncharacterized protein LOC132942446 [Metopolophium dirhodum]XP_060866822.1 uncharacterized protein LOC132942446 [Metopolophium dirhodum]
MEKLTNKSSRRSLFDRFSEEINNEESTSAFSNNRETMNMDDENSSIYENTNLNKHECEAKLKAFDDAFETIYGNNEVNLIQVLQMAEELQVNCIHLINLVKIQIKSTEVEKLRSKLYLLENKYLNTINKLQLEVTKLNLHLKQQSSFSCIIGSTFCYSLSKATQTSSAIDMVLQEDCITNMAQLITNMLSSFIRRYNNKMPSIKTNEMKFVLHMLRIVANLSTTESGCHFFSQVNDGINIVNLVVSLVLYTPPSHGVLKKIAYTTLYNVSNQFNGHSLMENNKLIQTLNNDIKLVHSKGNNSIILFSLNLLLSLTEKINKSMYTILKNEINLEEILKLTRYTETESTARKILNNINIASEKYNDKSE